MPGMRPAPASGDGSINSPSRRSSWPQPCPPGRRLAVVAPAAAVAPELLSPGVEWLRGAGYSVSLGPHVHGRHRYLAGTDAQRGQDLNDAIADDSVDGIIAARGGYGTMRILDAVDWDRWSQRRLPLVGFSDLTALQLALFRECGLVSYSGFAPAADVKAAQMPSKLTTSSFLNLLGQRQVGEVAGASICRDGEGRGVVLGGCLSLVVALLGTRWLPDLRGTILVLEDVGEDPYRIDRMLTQLRLAGVWEAVAGVVFGNFHNCPDPHGYFPELFAEVAGAVRGPVVYGAPYGHQADRVVLPIGADGTLCARDGAWRLTFSEP